MPLSATIRVGSGILWLLVPFGLALLVSVTYLVLEPGTETDPTRTDPA